MVQQHRADAIDNFKRGGITVLVATDIAARGIHVDNLDIVINYDIPMDAENYIHRIGRTARAGKDGVAYTFACEHFVEYLSAIEERIEKKIPSIVACGEDFAEDASVGVSWRADTDVKKHSPRSRRPVLDKRRNTKPRLEKTFRKSTSAK
jgi:ATP-dependent RNA helicase RhlB